MKYTQDELVSSLVAASRTGLRFGHLVTLDVSAKNNIARLSLPELSKGPFDLVASFLGTLCALVEVHDAYDGRQTLEEYYELPRKGRYKLMMVLREDGWFMDVCSEGPNLEAVNKVVGLWMHAIYDGYQHQPGAHSETLDIVRSACYA